MLTVTLISVNASGNYTGKSSGVSSGGGIVVPPRLPAKMPLNNQAINLFVKRFVEDNATVIKNEVNKHSGDLKLKSITSTDLNLKSGYVDVKFSFSYKYTTKVPIIGIPISKTVKGTAKVRLDLLICKDNKNLALRFNNLKDLNVNGIIESILAKIFKARDNVNKKMKGKIFGNTKLSYNKFNSSKVVDFLNVKLKDALKNRVIQVSKDFASVYVVSAKIKNETVKFKSVDVANTGKAVLYAGFVLNIKTDKTETTNGSFDMNANLVLKTADTSIWAEFGKIKNFKLDKEILSENEKRVLIRTIEDNMRDQMLCSLRTLRLN